MIPLLISLVIIGYYIYDRLIKVQKYWDEKGIPSSKSWPIVGDMSPIIFKHTSMAEHIVNIYNKFPNERYYGIHQFTVPTLVLKDVNLIKQIGIKDFDYFEDHRSLVAPEADPLLAKNLFGLKGQEWREMRATLSPAFTSSKMKAMFALISDCAEEFVKHYLKQGNEVITLEMKDTFARYANDVIASTAFGIKCDSLAERNNEFFLMGKDATNFSGIRSIVFALHSIVPSLMKYFKISFFSKHVSNFFHRIVKETIEKREKENIVRPDMIHLLMQARKGKLRHENHPKDNESTGFATVEESSIGVQEVKSEHRELTLEDMTAQALIFFFGGFDTTSTALSFMAHELAVNPDIHKRLQQEVDATLQDNNGKLTYEGITKMKYLDMVFSETLRKWPPGFMTDRVCTKPYTIPPQNPGENAVHLQKGDIMMIPCMAIHLDPKYFPNPEKFDPERFSDENKDNIVSGSYLPFGIGPRNCIGSRFAILENKALFVHILSKFDFVVVDKTQIPLRLSRKNFNLIAEKGYWLGLKARKINN